MGALLITFIAVALILRLLSLKQVAAKCDQSGVHSIVYN